MRNHRNNMMNSSNSVAPKEFLSPEECKALFNKIVGMGTGGGETFVYISSHSSGSAKWARNRVHVASDTRNTEISISRTINGAQGNASTTRLDDEGLLEVVRAAETSMQVYGESPENIKDPYIFEDYLKPTIWSDGTYNFGADNRTELVQAMIEGAESNGMLSAGNLQISGNGVAAMNSDGMFQYYPQTMVECSMTVRHPKGTASGWAGVNHYDLAKIDPKALAARALDKCLRSQNPVAVEPGRYTLIMEPQATADLFMNVMETPLDRRFAERPAGPFGKAPGRSKITEQVLDRRLIVRSDPMDTDGGFIPFDYSGTPYQPVNWIDQGILRELAYYKGYALSQLGLDKALPNPGSWRISAAPGVPTTTIEEMIAKTERGLLVTRFSNVQTIDINSMLSGGYTRDGLWLIEKGKITKPVKNFRFTESPIFALNSLEDIGEPQRVFAPGASIVAPAVRVRDFSFTSLADAI